jgi:hypothetical protein
MKYNSLLHNKSILYLLFLLTLANLAYFIYSKDNYSILNFALIATLVYLFTKNMIIVLGITIFIINILILARDSRKSREGYEDISQNRDISNNDCFEFTDVVHKNLYSNDISDIPIRVKNFRDKLESDINNTRDGRETDSNFYSKYISAFKSTDPNTQNWLNYNVVKNDKYKKVCSNNSKTIEPLENEIGGLIKDTDNEDKIFSDVIEKVKKSKPEVDELTKVFDMNELNRLINKLNDITDTFSKTNT